MIHYHEIVIHYDLYTVHTCHYKNKEITLFHKVVTKNIYIYFFFLMATSTTFLRNLKLLSSSNMFICKSMKRLFYDDQFQIYNIYCNVKQ